ncbi:MAG: TIGR00159 family protein [Clostridia bacterium]|nr:TIGR00159 family protein [Clostridia bacterium]
MNLLHILQTWTFKDLIFTVIDVGIVAFILYRLLLLVKGTKAVQLLKGLALLGAISIVSHKLGFATINWVLDKASLAVIVAIPVIFQPELRRILEQLGRGRFLGRPFSFLFETDGVTKLVSELPKAAETLAQRRIGALIVIERETGLMDYIETGVPIDGVVSPELILNIFFPNSPLHDGAVIIRGNRVTAAGCYLPLTDRPFLSKELGTRHRAALGITEESDAIAVVVSEETGVISAAFDGKLIRYLDGKKLRKMLEEVLLETEQPSF